MTTAWSQNHWSQGPCGTAPRRGFTVVELLVVIAIVLLLAGLCLGPLSRAKPAALSVRCKANLHQLSLALAMYVSDQNSYPLFDYTDGQFFHFWPDLIEPELAAPPRQSDLEP